MRARAECQSKRGRRSLQENHHRQKWLSPAPNDGISQSRTRPPWNGMEEQLGPSLRRMCFQTTVLCELKTAKETDANSAGGP